MRIASPSPLQSNGVIDARPNPRYATHLRPIFTEAIAEQQEKAHRQAAMDAEAKEMAQKAKQIVTVYGWSADGEAPRIKKTHDYVWPYLPLSPAILSAVGLSGVGESGDLLMFDEVDLVDWVAVDIGHVIDFSEGQRPVLLKCRSVDNCAGLDKIFAGASKYTTPHLYRHLPRERAYVREHPVQLTPGQSPCPSKMSSPSLVFNTCLPSPFSPSPSIITLPATATTSAIPVDEDSPLPSLSEALETAYDTPNHTCSESKLVQSARVRGGCDRA